MVTTQKLHFNDKKSSNQTHYFHPINYNSTQLKKIIQLYNTTTEKTAQLRRYTKTSTQHCLEQTNYDLRHI